MFKRMAIVVLAVSAWIGSSGCAKVPGTGRSQLMLISRSQEVQLGANAWHQFLAGAPVSGDTVASAKIKLIVDNGIMGSATIFLCLWDNG